MLIYTRIDKRGYASLRKYFIIMLLFTFLLSACSEKRTNKEIFVDALTSVMDLETYDITDLVDISVELEKEPRATTSNVYLDMLNNLDLKMNRKYRKEEDKIEYTYFIKGQVNPFQLDLTIPVLEDRKNNVAYMNIDSVVDNLGPILGLTEDYKGKIVEMDIRVWYTKI